MLSLEMSNGKYLTQEDLEKYLSNCSRFLIDSYKKEQLPEFEFEELRKKIICGVHENIIKRGEIELLVSDILKKESICESDIWDRYLYNSVKINGYEDIGVWDSLSSQKMDLYVIDFNIKYQNPSNPYSRIKDEYILPNYYFKQITSNIPENIRRGDRLKLKLNFYRDIIDFQRMLTYFDKINLNPSPKVSSNSNCFVVTTVMGDLNHPVVNDFRRYRDRVIVKSYLGRQFVSLYYMVGPYFSKIISNNRFLFKLSRLIVLTVHKKIK